MQYTVYDPNRLKSYDAVKQSAPPVQVKSTSPVSARPTTEFGANLMDLLIEIGQVVEPAARDFIERVMTKSGNLVPVESGVLKESAFVEVRQTARGITYGFGYGKDRGRRSPRSKKPPSQYAAIVHEAERHHENGTNKFLETPFNEEINSLPVEIRSRIRGILSGKKTNRVMGVSSLEGSNFIEDAPSAPGILNGMRRNIKLYRRRHG